MPSETGSNNEPGKGADADKETEKIKEGIIKEVNEEQPSGRPPSAARSSDPHMRRPSRPEEPFEQWERDEMEALLTEVRGHLGEFELGLQFDVFTMGSQ